MAPSRQPKGDLGSPNNLTEGGGSTSPDKLADIYQRLGSIQSSVTYLEGSAHDMRSEVKAISNDIVAAKAIYTTLKWVLGIVGAIILAIWGFMATVLTMMAKHYLGW